MAIVSRAVKWGYQKGLQDLLPSEQSIIRSSRYSARRVQVSTLNNLEKKNREYVVPWVYWTKDRKTGVRFNCCGALLGIEKRHCLTDQNAKTQWDHSFNHPHTNLNSHLRKEFLLQQRAKYDASISLGPLDFDIALVRWWGTFWQICTIIILQKKKHQNVQNYGEKKACMSNLKMFLIWWKKLSFLQFRPQPFAERVAVVQCLAYVS